MVFKKVMKAWNKGKRGLQKHSEETRRKMNELQREAQNRPEQKRKLSEFQTEYQNRPERNELQSKVLANIKIPKKYTKSEIILQEICNDEEIEFIKHKVIKLNNYESHHVRRHQVDLFIEPKICLLADGDVVHANPNPHMFRRRLVAGNRPDDPYIFAKTSKKYKSNKDKTDADAGITRDLESQGYTVLRFWESDLKYDTEKCRQKIIDVVRNVLQ